MEGGKERGGQQRTGDEKERAREEEGNEVGIWKWREGRRKQQGESLKEQHDQTTETQCLCDCSTLPKKIGYLCFLQVPGEL